MHEYKTYRAVCMVSNGKTFGMEGDTLTHELIVSDQFV